MTRDVRHNLSESEELDKKLFSLLWTASRATELLKEPDAIQLKNETLNDF